MISRRAKVKLEQAGLPIYGQRRVPGLRREEVASLAGVSIEYYERMERGNAAGASAGVLEALADALRLDDAERTHLFDPAAQEFFLDWEKAAKDLIAALRSMAGRNPYDRALSALVGELSTRSEAFRGWWAAHNVRYHQTGTKRLHHPVVGDLELSYEVMELAADAGLRLAIFTAEPGSRTEETLNLLASWAATPAQLPGERLAADDVRRS